MALEFERNIAELEGKIEGLKNSSQSTSINLEKEIDKLSIKLEKVLKSKYNNLSAWEKVLVARHPQRPHCIDYIKNLIKDFEELCGDRCFAEDHAIISGIGTFNGISIAVIGQEKGNSTEEKIKHNFGMPRPEGYRKAIRIMDLAEKFNLPLITFIDTAGAYPGIDAEERGQAQAIASSIAKMSQISVPSIAIIIGEGGSGGAMAIAAANKVLMLEHAIYSVISPEGCAAILWKDARKKQIAADAQKFTAQDLIKLNVIDQIINEPIGGAHRNKQQIIASVKQSIILMLDDLIVKHSKDIIAEKHAKFLNY